MGGVPTYWRTLQNDSYTNAAWTPVYLSFDAISPWAVGRFGNNAGADKLYGEHHHTGSRRVASRTEMIICPWFSPVFPGFNENGGPLNQTPRNGGSFLLATGL